MLKDYFDDNDAVFSVDHTAGDFPEGISAEAGSRNFCGCGDCKQQTSTENPDINSLPLAMAYVPMQKFRCLYSLEDALSAGTLFKELHLPFTAGSQGRGQR